MNGSLRVDSIAVEQGNFKAGVYTSVVKSGCRFVDEFALLECPETQQQTFTVYLDTPLDAEALA